MKVFIKWFQAGFIFNLQFVKQPVQINFDFLNDLTHLHVTLATLAISTFVNLFLNKLFGPPYLLVHPNHLLARNHLTNEPLPFVIRDLRDLLFYQVASIFLSTASKVVSYLVTVLDRFYAWFIVSNTAYKQHCVSLRHPLSKHLTEVRLLGQYLVRLIER